MPTKVEAPRDCERSLWASDAKVWGKEGKEEGRADFPFAEPCLFLFYELFKGDLFTCISCPIPPTRTQHRHNKLGLPCGDRRQCCGGVCTAWPAVVLRNTSNKQSKTPGHNTFIESTHSHPLTQPTLHPPTCTTTGNGTLGKSRQRWWQLLLRVR